MPGRDHVNPDENIWVDIDILMTHDICGPGTIGVFKQHFGKDAKVWDRDKVVIIPDHYIFTADAMANRNVDVLRQFAAEQNLKYFYDVGTPRYKGVCHIALPEEGHTRPGEVLLGTDSHTCTAGAFGEFATGIGNTDAGFVMGTGKLWLKVPPTMRFVFHGQLPPYLMAKDLILAIIGDIGCDGATYRAMEFDGDGVYRPEHRRTHDPVQHGHRGRRQERHHRSGPDHARLRQRKRDKAGKPFVIVEERCRGASSASKRSTT